MPWPDSFPSPAHGELSAHLLSSDRHCPLHTGWFCTRAENHLATYARADFDVFCSVHLSVYTWTEAGIGVALWKFMKSTPVSPSTLFSFMIASGPRGSLRSHMNFRVNCTSVKQKSLSFGWMLMLRLKNGFSGFYI